MSNSGCFIANNWSEGTGSPLRWMSPTDAQITWEGRAADPNQIDAAVAAARSAQADWSRRPLGDRTARIESFAVHLQKQSAELIDAICRETGKPQWEAATEVDAMIRKAPISITAFHERRQPAHSEQSGETAATRYKPHGVVAVFGPFNLPGHLPNGHIIPALLAGNTVVFKPSEQSPRVGELTVRAWEAAGLPPGVMNLIQGGRDAAIALSSHPGLDGLYFTGSYPVGQSLSRMFASNPGKILALEMGGNNPLIVWQAKDFDAAAYLTIVSAFITSGQRCSCARRLVIPDSEDGDLFLNRLVEKASVVRVDRYDARPQPFMGTVISAKAAAQVLDAQADLLERGARTLLQSRKLPAGEAMLTPGILDVTAVKDRSDTEIFGPLLQVIRVSDFDAAISEANRTRYGLSAGLLSDDRTLYEKFYDSARAGLINWNRPLTGASSALPFGGIGNSGNNRPGGSWAADYCSYPVASLESPRLTNPVTRMPGL